MGQRKGWHNESHRHSLASRGIKTLQQESSSTDAPLSEWIGKTLMVKKDASFNIISGSSAYGIELKSGQTLKVVGVQSGGWLQAVLTKPVVLHEEAGIQMSEMQERYHGAMKHTTSSGIVIGVSLNFDMNKVDVLNGGI